MADIAETNHAMNDDYYFDGNFPNAKLRPYDDYKNMSTLNTYCGGQNRTPQDIAGTFVN
jgi:hypothetical protein